MTEPADPEPSEVISARALAAPRTGQAISFTNWLENVGRGLQSFADGLRTGLVNLGQGVLRIAKVVGDLFLIHQGVIASGWFPSLLIPYAEILARFEEPEFCIDTYLRQYFVDHFEEVAAKMTARITQYAPDDHCKAVLAQTMEAHRTGLYFCVAPTIFSEIERLVRNSLKIEGALRANKIKALFKEMKLVHLAALAQVGPVMFTDILTDQVYRDTRGLTATEMKFLNRHAVIHGFQKGSGMKDSMNALMLADSVIAFLHMKANGMLAMPQPANPENKKLKVVKLSDLAASEPKQ